MTETANEMLIHQIKYEKYKNNEVKKVLKILSECNSKIAELLKKSKIIGTKKKYNEVTKEIKNIVKSARDSYQGAFDIDSILDEEMASNIKLIEKGIYADVNFKMPGVSQVKQSVMFKPMVALNNRTFDETFNYFQDNLYTTWDSALRSGFITGQTTSDIVKTVMGSVTGKENDLKPNRISQIRKSVELNTRTILQSFSDESHRAVYEENEDVIDGYRILATLDRRTCLVCGSLAEKKYSRISDVPELPVHYNCRCVVIPMTKWDRDYNGKQASEFGEVDDDLTYEQWLATQSDKIQKEILGGRYQFYKSGKSLEKQFFNGNELISIKELKEND